MERGQKFNSFYDKIVDYQKRKLLIIKNDAQRVHAGEYTKEYKTLSKAKKDILDKIKSTLDGALTFSEIVAYGDTSKEGREQWTRTRELSKDPNLEDYIFQGESKKIKQELYDHSNEFAMNAFDEKTIDRLLDSVFSYGSSDEIVREYRINVAKKMLKKSIGELKQHLPIEWEMFLTPKLDEAVAICDTINKNPKKIKREKLNRILYENRRQR